MLESFAKLPPISQGKTTFEHNEAWGAGEGGDPAQMLGGCDLRCTAVSWMLAYVLRQDLPIDLSTRGVTEGFRSSACRRKSEARTRIRRAFFLCSRTGSRSFGVFARSGEQHAGRPVVRAAVTLVTAN